MQNTFCQLHDCKEYVQNQMINFCDDMSKIKIWKKFNKSFKNGVRSAKVTKMLKIKTEEYLLKTLQSRNQRSERIVKC